MDPFTVVIGGMLFTLVVALLVIGRFYPGDGGDVLNWNPQRKAELDAQNEIDDMEQMLVATNRRRAARGKPALTENALRDQVTREERAMRTKREESRAEEDVAQMLEAKNARRRERGQSELTCDEYKQSLGL